MQASDLSALLKSKYESDDEQYMHQLKHGKDAILESFGGLHNLLQLYLTNTIDDEMINQLHSLITQAPYDTQENDVTSDVSIVNDINRQNQLNRTQLFTHYTSVNVLALEKLNTKTHVVPTIQQQRDVFVPEILKVDMSENLYFQIFHSRETSYWFYHNVVKSKYMNLFICVLLLLSLIMMGYSAIWGPNDTSALLYAAWSYSISWLFILWTIMHIFGFNTDLMWATTQTFDFGYKVYQGIVLSVSFPSMLIPAGYTLYDVIMTITLIVVGFTFVLYIDAMSLKVKSKLILLFVITLLLCFVPVFIYFFIEDVFWDPFDGEWGPTLTRISFKSATITAFINAVLMFCKVLGSGIKSNIMDSRKPNKKALIKNGYAKSVSLLNRPYIRWVNYNQNNKHSLSHKDITQLEQNLETMHENATNNNTNKEIEVITS